MVGKQHRFGMKTADTSLHPKEGTKELCEHLGHKKPFHGKDLKLHLKGGKYK